MSSESQNKKKRKTAFAEGTKEQTERYAPLSGRAGKGGANGSNGVDSASDHSAKRPRKPSRGDDDDDESTVASTGEMSSISGVAAVSDVAGMLEDDEHMRTSYRLREVATWLRLPYDEQRKPKRHTTARAHDTAKLGGELWLLRVPADLDLSLLNGASFDDADLDGETPIDLAPDAARSAVQLDDDESRVRLVLAARPQEVSLAFKCAFPAVVRVREDDDNEDGNESSVASRTINHLRFGAPFDRAFSVHRWSAPVSQSTTLNPAYDEQFLDNRARVKPVPREALRHKFLPIGAAANATETAAAAATSTAASRSTAPVSSSKQSKKEKKKEKKKHRSDESDGAATVTKSSHKQGKEKKSKSSKH